MGTINFKSMRWSNAFSYGQDNYIEFDKNPITQLVGKNGHGKSSIALILEEALFNKNSKGVKKASIINRYAKAKSYEIEVVFSKDSDVYRVHTVRGSSQTVTLYKNDQDISAHTSTGTYKLIEEVLGYDHKNFTQIVYQSDPFSLEFLTSTDTARKKFLIDLLDLHRYSAMGDVFKERLKELNKQAEVTQMKLAVVKGWLANFNPKDLVKKEPKARPILDPEADKKLMDIRLNIKNIEALNTAIEKNNRYKELKDSVQLIPIVPKTFDIPAMSIEVSDLQKQYDALDKLIKGTGPILTKCPSCGQAVDNSHKQKMLEEAKEGIAPIKEKLDKAKVALTKAREHTALVNKANEAQALWEKYHSAIDYTMQETPHNKVELEKAATSLSNEITAIKKLQQEVDTYNASVAAHNAKADVLNSQKLDNEKDLVKYQAELDQINSKISIIQVLTKVFSSSGLVAYKIEVLVKDLEKLVNDYLADMSGGRFQLSFKLSQGDKLDVVITDNGKDIDITALSNGELARVNVSTLLAIRKLMQGLSNTNTNLLILDETVESLDADGKEKLVEVLMSEEHLNTILVSHGFSHPLLEKVSIVKTGNISRIE